MELNNYEEPQIEILVLDDADILTVSTGEGGYAGATGNAGGYWQNYYATMPAQQTAPVDPK